MPGIAGAKAKLFMGAFGVVLWLIVTACSEPSPPLRALNDFESDGDLDRVHWKCRIMLALADKHVTSGLQSLQLTLFPATYPGLALKLDEHDWRDYRYAALDIFNPQKRSFAITVRIDDKLDYPTYDDRFQGHYQLVPGANSLRIPLEDLTTSGGGRPLNLKTIRRFMWFLVDTREVYTFYVDNIRLER